VLNLRDGAGTWAEVIDRMYQDEHVTVLDGPTDDGWYYVDYQGEEGWAYGGYMIVNGDQGWGDWSGVGGYSATAWVGTDRLNVRADASMDAGVLDRLSMGDEISVVGDPVNGFTPIDDNGQRGYVWSDFISWEKVSSGPEHWIDVNRSSQTVTLMAGDEAVDSFWASMGYDHSSDGFYSTAIGTYYVFSKFQPLSWTDWGKVYIEDWVGFDPDRDNGFHSYSMDADGNVLSNGDGQTGGCIAMAPWAAEELYNFASYGMRVEVHW